MKANVPVFEGAGYVCLRVCDMSSRSVSFTTTLPRISSEESVPTMSHHECDTGRRMKDDVEARHVGESESRGGQSERGAVLYSGLCWRDRHIFSGTAAQCCKFALCIRLA